jgi:formamidopyrimidine-DNA glycosylase
LAWRRRPLAGIAPDDRRQAALAQPDVKLAGRQNLAAFDFPNGSLVLTEAGAKHRASLHVVSGEEALRSFDAGGIDVFAANLILFVPR